MRSWHYTWWLRWPTAFHDFLRGLPEQTWEAFEQGVRQRWPERADRIYSDAFLEAWLGEVWRDSNGFGGCKAIRRIIGLAKVSDIETLDGGAHVVAATMVLRTARRWIVERQGLQKPAHLVAVFDEVAEEVGT